MDLSLTADEIAFRDAVRRFLDDALKPEWRGVADSDARARPEIAAQWQAALARQGWLTPAWPARFGGCGWTPMRHHIFRSECSRRGAPKISAMSFGMVGPLICAFGSEAQQSRYLPRIVSGADIWCQGFSEPGAGSDLAAIKTTARLDGDAYIVTGQKIWTTYAHRATQMLCLAKTDPNAARPQAGISILLIDMALPGITVRPIRTIDGEHHFNEVFLDEVRAPAHCRLGEENKGWDYARFLLTHERSGIADVMTTRGILDQVAGVAAAEPRSDGRLLDDGDFGARLARLDIALDALEILELRTLDAAERGESRDHDASMLKILGTELKQNALLLGVEALGPLGAIAPADGAPAHASGMGRHFVTDALFFRAASIYGGANEIQRNIVAKAMLRPGYEG
jgi:alkylation response protein AidB-like acyl-CoA dehydrogenase